MGADDAHGGDPVIFTRFRRVTDPCGRRYETTWEGEILRLQAIVPRDLWRGRLPSQDEKMVLPGWSAATFRGDRRALGNTELVHAIVFDFDSGVCPKNALRAIEGVRSYWYTSPSNSPAHRKFRLVMAVSRPMTAPEYGIVWQWGADRFAGHAAIVDPAARDPSRFWYDYCPRPGWGHAVESQPGRPINIDRLLWRASVTEPVAQSKPAPVTYPNPAPWEPSTARRVKRAIGYAQHCPPAIEGSRGQNALFMAAQNIGLGFDLPLRETIDILAEHWNPKCSPPWTLSNARDKKQFEGIVARSLKSGKMQRGKHL